MIQEASSAFELVLPAYVLALFDEAAGGEGGEGGADGGAAGAGADGGSAGGNEGGGGTAVVTRARPAARSQAVATRIESDDPAELRRALEDSDRRIRELNAENQKHRTTAKELKSELTSVSTSVALSNQRAIRAETKVALAEAGAIDADVVDLLLKAAGDKIKIDPSTGDVVGVHEAITEYKAKKPSFFKAVAAIVDDKKSDDAKTDAEKKADEDKAAKEKADADKKAADEDEAKKKNATAGGTSTAGTAGGKTTTVGGLADLRNMSREERTAAIADYKRAVKRGGR